MQSVNISHNAVVLKVIEKNKIAITEPPSKDQGHLAEESDTEKNDDDILEITPNDSDDTNSVSTMSRGENIAQRTGRSSIGNLLK